jgi:hypothetical protein
MEMSTNVESMTYQPLRLAKAGMLLISRAKLFLSDRLLATRTVSQKPKALPWEADTIRELPGARVRIVWFPTLPRQPPINQLLAKYPRFDRLSRAPLYWCIRGFPFDIAPR